MSYGDLSPEGRQMAEAELAAKTAKLETEIAHCPYCKAAKTRQAAGRTGNVPRYAECKRHRERRRLNYVTSPLSETYWAS